MALSDYTDLEKEISEAPAPKVLARGTEVKARVIGIREGISDKNDCQWRQVIFDVPDDPMVTEFNDFMWELDKEKLDAKQYQRSLYQFQQFAAAFGLDYSRPFDWEGDVVGLEGWLIVGLRTSDDFGEQNTVKKYIAPK